MSDVETVVVTGASAGIGRATAIEFARRGARIGLLARSREGLEGARCEVEAAGGRGLIVPTDVADAEQVEQAAALVEDTLGPIDVWVNDAMVSMISPVAESTADEIRRVTEVTYLGTVHGTLAALRRMRPRDRGSIVQVGSALAYRGIPLQAPYCAAKHAVRGFTESLRCELAHERSRVYVTMVQLPAVNTPQFDWIRCRLPNQPQPVPPIFQPEVPAEAIYWAAHHRRRELFVGWPAVKVIWGNKIAPWLADRVLARNGYRQQQTDEPISEDRVDNLFEPAFGDHGAHGRFDARARSRSLQLRATLHRRGLAGAAAAAGLALAFAYAISRKAGRC